MNNDVKQRILSESMHLMFSHGIKVMTMDELAKRIGVSKRTIYEHFEDKDALLTAILQENKKQKQKHADKILKESPNVIHVFFKYLNNEKPDDFFSKLISRTDEIKRYHPDVFQKEFAKHTKHDFERLKKIFQLGIEQGVFRKNLEPDVVTAVFHTSLYQIFENENGLRQYFSLEKIFETYMLIFIRGCCTEKGLKVVEAVQKGKK
jgi:AcrR family transcriptional regulator